MKAGISTACFFPLYTEKTVPVIADFGAEVCEVFFEAESEYNLSYARRLKRVAQENNIEIASVHAFCATFEQFLFTNYERRRKDALKSFIKATKAARELGAKSYTFHGDRRTDEIDSLDYKHYEKCFKELLDITSSYGIKLCWENVSWCQSSRPEFIKRIKEYVNPAEIYHTLDLKQARRAQTTADEYLNVMGGNLKNVHINDYDEVSDCILPGCGKEDFPLFFDKLRKLGYNGNLIIEVYRSNFNEYSEIKSSLDFVKEALKQ